MISPSLKESEPGRRAQLEILVIRLVEEVKEDVLAGESTNQIVSLLEEGLLQKQLFRK